jgi:hypothetical protein
MTKELHLYTSLLKFRCTRNYELCTSVRATVIYKKELQRTITLSNEAINTTRECILCLINRDDYGDEGKRVTIHKSKCIGGYYLRNPHPRSDQHPQSDTPNLLAP